jgi:Cu/Zn superoxide dismutase
MFVGDFVFCHKKFSKSLLFKYHLTLPHHFYDTMHIHEKTFCSTAVASGK